MAENNPLMQSFYAQQLGADKYKKLLEAQQQEALGNALMQQGQTPIDTNNRQIGGIGYKISPWEGVAKLAQALTGGVEQASGNQALADALLGGSSSGDGSGTSGKGSGVQTPALPPGWQLNPEEALKASYGNYYADHRPGATYRDPGTGQFNYAPTDSQLNTNTAPPPPGASQPPVAPQQPAMQPQGAPIPNGTPAPPVVPVQQAGGIPLPPPATAFNNPQIPSGTSPTIANVATSVASNAMPPASQAGPLLSQHMASQAGFSPPNTAGMSASAAQNAMDVAKAAAIEQGKIAPAGATAEAQKTGDNAAEAAKTLNVMSANLPVLQKRISDMTEANHASSLGPWNDPSGNGMASKIADYRNGPASIANAKLQQLTAQNVLPELGPALAQAGIKGNKFLETLSSTASGVDLSKGQQARQAQIDGLMSNYAQNMRSTYQQVKNYGGDPASIFSDPPSVANAVKLGIIPREEGISILQKNHGFK